MRGLSAAGGRRLGAGPLPAHCNPRGPAWPPPSWDASETSPPRGGAAERMRGTAPPAPGPRPLPPSLPPRRRQQPGAGRRDAHAPPPGERATPPPPRRPAPRRGGGGRRAFVRMRCAAGAPCRRSAPPTRMRTPPTPAGLSLGACALLPSRLPFLLLLLGARFCACASPPAGGKRSGAATFDPGAQARCAAAAAHAGRSHGGGRGARGGVVAMVTLLFGFGWFWGFFSPLLKGTREPVPALGRGWEHDTHTHGTGHNRGRHRPDALPVLSAAPFPSSRVLPGRARS